VQVGVGRSVCSIVSSNPQEERNAFSEARQASESLCHIPDTFGIRSQQHHAPELKAEFAFRPASRGGPVAIAANKFHRIVLKMRQAQTFLATFENDDCCHENVGRYLSFGTAHAFGCCLYGPVADKRATGGSAHELTLAEGAGVRSEPWGINAFRGSISQARQRTRRFPGFPYRNADFGRLKFSVRSAIRPRSFRSEGRRRALNTAQTRCGNMLTSLQTEGDHD
jgi:hypothetical protein